MSGSKRNDAPSAEETVKSDVAEKVSREGERIANLASDTAKEFSREQKAKTHDFLNDLSSVMEQGGERLDSGGHHTTAQVVNYVAEELNSVAREFDKKSAADLIREVERFAHERPAIFFGAALVAGFGASRFLKSAREESAGSTVRNTAPPSK